MWDVSKKICYYTQPKPNLTSVRGDMWDVSKEICYYAQPNPYLISARGDKWDVSKKMLVYTTKTISNLCPWRYVGC